MFQKDLNTRLIEVIDAWGNMRPHKSFFGLTLDGLRLKAKPYLDARKEIVELDKQLTHAASKRDQAAPELLLILQGVVMAVCGDPEETQNGELYGESDIRRLAPFNIERQDIAMSDKKTY